MEASLDLDLAVDEQVLAVYGHVDAGEEDVPGAVVDRGFVEPVINKE
jgi:hypothetical protein